jgi:formate dehydrogenase major subunit
MTARTRNQALQPADVLDVCAHDAERAGLRDGEQATLVSRHGRTTLPIHITDSVRPGELFTTFHTAAACVNYVTGPHRDAITHTPAYKVTAVQLLRG